MDGPNANSSNDGGIVKGAQDFAQAFAYSAFEAPVDAVRQLAGAPVSALQSAEQSLFSKAGSIAGTVVDYAVLAKVLKGVVQPLESTFMARSLPILQPALGGGFLEASRPADLNGNDLWTAKRNQFLIGGVTFGVMGGVQSKLSNWSLFGRAGQRSLTDSIVANSLAGGAAGGVGSLLDAGLNQHRDASDAEFFQAMGTNAAFGAMFGVADVALGLTKTSIKLSSDIQAGKVPGDTAAWVKDGYDPNVHIRSPIFDYIARTNPDLRPPHYEAWKAQLAGKSLNQIEELSLSDFKPEQRPALVAKLRSLARSDLASDRNIDAFIKRLTDSNISVLSENAQAGLGTEAVSLKQWKTQFKLLDGMRQGIAPDKSFKELINDQQFLQANPQFGKQLGRTLEAEGAYNAVAATNTQALTPLAGEFQSALAQVARESHLPEPIVDLSEKDGGGGYLQDKISMSPQELNPGVSTGTVETSWHEFRHHEDGTWSLGNIKALMKMKFKGLFSSSDSYSVKPIGASHRVVDKIGSLQAWSNQMNTPGAGLDLAKQIVDKPGMLSYISGEEPGYRPESYRSVLENPADFTDGAFRSTFKEMMENRIHQLMPLARTLYMNYVTEPAELRAYSTGILARMRAQAWKLPEPIEASTSNSMPDSLLQYKQ